MTKNNTVSTYLLINCYHFVLNSVKFQKLCSHMNILIKLIQPIHGCPLYKYRPCLLNKCKYRPGEAKITNIITNMNLLALIWFDNMLIIFYIWNKT